MTTQPIVVWTEIPVRDVAKAAAFYDKVFGYTTSVDTSGPQPMAMLNNTMEGVGASLILGDPAPGTILHISLPDALEAGIARAEAAGGKVLTPAVEIPYGRFVYATDPDGNKIGLFEPKG
jgi:uncharacterized protein